MQPFRMRHKLYRGQLVVCVCNTRWMIEFSVLRSCTYGSPGDETRLFLTEDGYQAALLSHQRREIKIKKCAHVIEGHVLYVKKKRRK